MKDGTKKDSIGYYIAVIGTLALNFFYGFFVFLLASKNSLGGTFYYVAYFLLAFSWIYIALSPFSKSVRNVALNCLLFPWCFLLLILIPQFNDEPESVSLFIIAFISLVLMRVPGELVVRNIVKSKAKT